MHALHRPAPRPDPRELAHDIGTPIAKLRLYARALEDALPRLLRGSTRADTAMPSSQLATDLLPDIPARLHRLADDLDQIAARLLMLADGSHAKVRRSADAACTSPAADPRHPLMASKHTGRPRVLLVEDDIDSRDLSAMMLDRDGWDVTTAGDGGPALRLLDSQHFDLVLMDCRLPELDGWTATQRMRADGPNERTPIIGLTSSSDSVDKERGLAAGMDDWIVKPLTPAHLSDLRKRRHT